MAPVRETYVPVPGIDYIEPASERKFDRNPTKIINPRAPPSSSFRKTPSKAPSTPEISISTSKTNRTSRLATQDSAANAHTSIGSLKSKETPVSKKSSLVKSKASPSRKASSKQVVKPGSKVLSTELVTVSDDEDSDADVNGQEKKANGGGGKGGRVAEIELGKDGIGRSDVSLRTNGLSRNEEENYGGVTRPGVLRKTNGLVENSARSTSASSSSDSGDSSESDNGSRSNDNVPREANKRKNAATSSSQSKTGGSPAKRARLSGLSKTSITNGDSSSVSPGSDKMDVGDSVSDGIGPSAQPVINVNGTASRRSGSVDARRHIRSKHQTSTLSSETDSESSSSNSDDSSTSQSDIAIDDRMDTSADKNITATATTRASISTPKRTISSSRRMAAGSASTSHLDGNTATTAMPTITPPLPPEPLSQSSLSSFNGKQIWHITLPANIPIESIPNIPSSAISTSSATGLQTPVVAHEGAEYVLSRGSEAEERDAHVFVAATGDDGREGGFKRLKRDVDAVWHVRLAPKLPSFLGHTRQADGNDASRGTNNGRDDYDTTQESSDSSEVMLRPLPQGLKMRWLPSGCAPLSDDSENDSVDDIITGSNVMSAETTSSTVNTSNNHNLMPGLVFRNRKSSYGTASHDGQARIDSYKSSTSSTNVEATKNSLSSSGNNDNTNNNSSNVNGTKKTKDESRSKSKSKSKSKSEKQRQPREINGHDGDINPSSKIKDDPAAVHTSIPKNASPSHKSVHPVEQPTPSLPVSITAPAKATSTSTEARAAKKAQKEERRQRRDQKALKKMHKTSKETQPLETKVNRRGASNADKQDIETEMDRKRKKQERKERKEQKREKKEKRKKVMNA